jgi:hypothetical protein
MIEAGADRLGTSATTYIYDAYMWWFENIHNKWF